MQDVYTHQKGYFQDFEGVGNQQMDMLVCLSQVTIWVPKCTGAAVMQRWDNCGHRILVPSEAQNAKGHSVYQQERQTTDGYGGDFLRGKPCQVASRV